MQTRAGHEEGRSLGGGLQEDATRAIRVSSPSLSLECAFPKLEAA